MPALAAILVLLAASSSASAQTSVRVEFTAEGECVVTAAGPTGRASVKSPLRTSELKCVVPVPRAAGAVNLEVALPPGVERPTGAFPRLAWAERDGRWVGAASLPAAPAFVRVPDTARGARRERVLDLLVLAGALLGAVWAVAKSRAP